MKRALIPAILLTACSGPDAVRDTVEGGGDGVMPVAAIWEQSYDDAGIRWNVVLDGAFAGEKGAVRVHGGTDETVAHALAARGCREAGRSFDPAIPVRFAEVPAGSTPSFVYDGACQA